MSDSQSADVSRTLALIRDRWYIVGVVSLLVVAVAWMYSTKIAEPRYEATALVTYAEPKGVANPTGGALPSNGVTRENIQTLIGNASATGVAQRAAKTAGVDVDVAQKSVKINPHNDASIIDFVASDDSADGAAALANAYAAAFVADRRGKAGKSVDALISGTQTEIKSLGKVGPEDPRVAFKVTLQTKLSDLRTQRQQWTESILVSNEAAAPVEPVWPRTKLTLAAALIVGFGLGAGIALVTASVDRRIHGDEFDALPAPVVVRVPVSNRAARNAPLSPASAEPIVADSFAALGSRMMLEQSGESALVILVTSARSGEGKSTVAANLSAALAQGGRRVVLIDADMRKPTQETIFAALQGRPGLSQVLMRTAEVEQSLTLVAPNLAAIPSGPRQSNASVLLASVAFRQLIDRLSNISDVIVIDAPPVLAVTDALAMAPVASQVLLAARVGASNVAEIAEAHRRIGSSASTQQSIVLLGTRRPTGYGYDSPARTAAPQIVAYPQEHQSPGATGLPVAPPQPGSSGQMSA